MCGDPAQVTIGQVQKALNMLGVEVEPRDLRSVTITGRGIEVVRYRRTDSGHLYRIGAEVATVTTSIGIVDTPDAA